MWARSLARTTVAVCWLADRKNCPRLTPSAFAIFSIEEIEGEHCPFSICDRKLAEKSTRSARARKDMPCCSLRPRRELPRLFSIILVTTIHPAVLDSRTLVHNSTSAPVYREESVETC